MSESPQDPVARIAGDRALRDVLIAARGWTGPSPSRFRGRPVRTDYVLDEHGRVIGSVTDPDWTDDDRDLALALLAYEAGLCHGCGHPLAETTDPNAEETYQGDLVRCHRCTAAEQVAEQYRENPQPGSLRYSARPRAPHQHDDDPPEPTDPPQENPDDPRLDAG